MITLSKVSVLREVLFSALFLFGLVISPDRATLAGRSVDVVYPADGHVARASRIFVLGSAAPGTRVLVNSVGATTYRNGAFLALLPLEPGLNQLVTVATGPQGTSVDRRTVVRIPPPTTMPERPAAIRMDSLSPAEDVALLPGDGLRLSFQGSPGGRAAFAVGDSEPLPMEEMDPSSTQGIRGIYAGEYLAGPQSLSNIPITVTFVGADGATINLTARGRLSVWQADPRIVAQTLDGTVLREVPEGRRLGELPQGVKLQVAGRVGAFTKVRLTATMVAWVPNQSIRPVADGIILDGDVLDVRTVKAVGSTDVRVSLTSRLPFIITQQTKPEMLVLTIYGVRSVPSQIETSLPNGLISAIDAVSSEPGVFQLRIMLNVSQQWGYQASYEDDSLVLAIRHPPHIDAPSPLAGRVIAIDAGHGGPATGAMGPTRLMEKGVNLAIALRLRDLLEQAGARVVMTRTEDRDVELAERVVHAQRGGAELLVSIHNNNLPDGEDPFVRHGTGTYYFHPHSRMLAEAMHNALVQHLALRDDGLWERSFVLTRPTQMPSVLVEVAYMIYPPEEDLLRRPAFQGRAALAIMKGIEVFLRRTR